MHDSTPQRSGTAEPRPIRAIRLVGGSVCLDFVNTIHDRHAVAPEDYLATPERYLDWSRRVGLLDGADCVAVPDAPAARLELMAEVRALRDALHAVFSARIDGHPPDAVAVRVLDGWLHRAWADLVLDGDARLRWARAADARRPLQRIALSALELLEDTAPARLKRCAARGECGWLFVDTSRNNRRRWCAMETCGTADKMARYRTRGVAGD
jgi:predicted RNA-binding Zn ribbon-like protein